MTALAPRLDLEQHFALYRAFHRGRATKVLHGVFVPLIMFTGFLVFGAVPVVEWRLPVAMAAAMCAILAFVDPLGSVCLGALFGAAAWIAAALADRLPWWSVLPLGLAVHAASWWVMVSVVHQRFEPPVVLPGGAEDSNVYFRRGWFLARGLGAPVGALDHWIQFLIAPLAVVQDGFALLGVRRELEARCDRASARLLDRLARGAPPLAGDQDVHGSRE